MNRQLALQATAEDLRLHLSIPYVLHLYGHEPAAETGTRLHYHSPFRQDTNPSFDVWKNDKGEWRCGDFAEGWTGSVIDLMKRLGGPDTDPFERCRGFLAAQVEDGWVDTEVPQRPKELADDTNDRLARGQVHATARATALLGEMVHSRPGLMQVPATHLTEEWRVVGNPDGPGVLIPSYDADLGLLSVKTRSGDTKKNAAGSRLDLYGLWRLRDGLPVLLVEGESDAWAASYLLPGYDVLAVPGAGVRPDKTSAACLADRYVIVAFDGDDAGRTATKAWVQALYALGCTVAVAVLPNGRDISSLPPGFIESLPQRSRPVQPPPLDLGEAGNAYVRLNGNNGARPITNWILRVERVLRSEDGSSAFEGTVLPHRQPVVLPVDSLASQPALTRWCNQFGGTWTGGSGDHQRLLQYLLAEASLAPEGRMTRQVGYHAGDFVWPDGHIGTDDWTYVPPPSKINLSGRIHIASRECDVIAVLDALLSLHNPSITGPMLAWMAVAPLRPLFDRFPILSISGGSGSGKTTLTEKMLRVFSGSEITTNLTSTTPYAVTAFFASSNAIPVWFDEYRPGAREDARTQLDQLLRDCYTGQPSYKGGMSENKSEVVEIPTVVPVVVTGEDSFQETSHTDRMVLVRLTKQGRGDLSRLDGLNTEGFAHAYLSWLLLGEPPEVNLRLREVPGLNERQSLNMEVLKYGWHLLQAFAFDHDPSYKLPKIDLSSVVAQAAEAAESNPLLEAVRWALESVTFLDAAWVEGEWVCVHPVNLLSEVRKTGAFVLPTSNARGVRALLRDQHSGEDVRVRRHDRQVRVVRIPLTDVVTS